MCDVFQAQIVTVLLKFCRHKNRDLNFEICCLSSNSQDYFIAIELKVLKELEFTSGSQYLLTISTELDHFAFLRFRGSKTSYSILTESVK